MRLHFFGWFPHQKKFRGKCYNQLNSGSSHGLPGQRYITEKVPTMTKSNPHIKQQLINLNLLTANGPQIKRIKLIWADALVLSH